MAYCGEHCISTTEGRDRLAVSLRCRSWLCAECAGQRQRQLVAKACAGHPTRLITLTSRRSGNEIPHSAAQALVRAWRLIRRQIRRDDPSNRVEFLAIFEQTKTGWPHLHILVRSAWIDQAWLSRQMQRLTNSPIVDIRAIHSKRGAAKYVAKYTAKGPGKFGTLKRYWASKAWEVVPYVKRQGSSGWEVQRMSLTSWMDAWRTFGWTVELVDHMRARARPPP